MNYLSLIRTELPLKHFKRNAQKKLDSLKPMFDLLAKSKDQEARDLYTCLQENYSEAMNKEAILNIAFKLHLCAADYLFERDYALSIESTEEGNKYIFSHKNFPHILIVLQPAKIELAAVYIYNTDKNLICSFVCDQFKLKEHLPTLEQIITNGN